MTRYEQIFGNVDKEAQNLLTHIGQYLQGYSETTQDHFKKLGTIANEHIGNATNRIAGSIDELSQQLDELQGIVGGIARASKMAIR